MRFIAQVALDPSIPARMAYLFMTDEEEFVDGGENAVILQPGTFAGPTIEQEGPTLYRMVGSDRLVPEPCEFAVSLAFGEDSDGFADQIGGTPAFLQGEEYPEGGPWRLLLQLDSSSVPFYVNFGDAGVGYALISEDGTAGKFLWQCG